MPEAAYDFRVVESDGYHGILVGSSRAIHHGNMIVLFGDQGANLQSIIPHIVEFRLVDEKEVPFHNHATQILDFTAGEVRFTKSVPAAGAAHTSWRRVSFNH